MAQLARRKARRYWECDGRMLAATESAPIALVQSHKLFPALLFLNTISYFQEMARAIQDARFTAVRTQLRTRWTTFRADATKRYSPFSPRGNVLFYGFFRTTIFP